MAKEQTEEEKAEEARATNVKKTLESKLIQNSAGSNMVLSNQSTYGDLGVKSAQSIYDQSMSSDEAKKMKEEDYQEKVKKYRTRGVFGDPAYPSNGDLSNKLMAQLDEVMSIARLSELEKAVKDVGGKLDVKLPDELKDYIPAELIDKAVGEDGKINIKSLNEEEQKAFGYYQTLTQFYKRACALKVIQANYFADLNAQLKPIADSYKKEEKKKE